MHRAFIVIDNFPFYIYSRVQTARLFSGPIYFVSSSVATALFSPVTNISPSSTTQPPVIYRLEDVYIGHKIATMSQLRVSFWHVPKLILEAKDIRQLELISLHNVRASHSMLDAHTLFDLRRAKP